MQTEHNYYLESEQFVVEYIPSYEYDSPSTDRSISLSVPLPEVEATGACNGK